MKKTCLIIGLAGFVAFSSGLGFSSESSVEQGQQLFNDPSLGGSANETSCASCHPDGKGLENAKNKTNLAHMINVCIERPLEGQALEAGSPELESLQRYIKSLK